MVNERERLVELIRQGYSKGKAKEKWDLLENTMADYLLENGVVVLPCKCDKCSHRCNDTNECGIYGRICTEKGYCDKALKGGNKNE